jgi:hypothetical protein
MAATDATPIPVKNQAYRVTFPILDADGDLVTGATGLDSEVSKDAGTYTDCTNEATEIATASGTYYLDLTATEMNADTVAIIVKTTSSGAKTTPMVLYPNKTGGLSVNVTSWAGTATGTGNVAIKNTLAKTTDITGFNDISTANVQTELGTYGALKPTTAGRTLDISTGGEAGIDWANIGGQGTTVGLSATTIANATNVTNPVTLTAAYDAAKTASTQASVNTISGYVDTEVGAIKTVTDKLDTALELDGAVYRYTTNALEQAPTGGGGAPTAATIADAVWDELLSGHTTAGSAGAALIGAGSAGDPWSAMLPGSYGAGSAGYLIGNNLDAQVSSRSTYGGGDTAGTTELLVRIPSAFTITSGKVDVNDKTGFALTSAYDAAKTASTQASNDLIKAVTDKLNTALEVDGPVYRYTTNALEQAPTGGGGAADPWLTLLPGAYGAGTAGKILGTNLDVAVSTRATQASVDGVAAKTGNLPSDPADASDITAQFATVNSNLTTISGYIDTEVGAIKAKTDNLPSDPADASDIALSFNTVNNKLDVIDDYVDTEIAAIKAKTDQLTFTAGKVDANVTPNITDMNAMADALLKRDWNSVTGEAAYSALNAFRMLRNAWNTTGGTLTVKKEDGTATAWTRSLGTDPAAQPIISAT